MSFAEVQAWCNVHERGPKGTMGAEAVHTGA